MSVHMVQIVAENPSDTTLEDERTAVNDWIDSYSETLELQSGDLIETESVDGQQYLYGYWRFEISDDKTSLLDDAENALSGVVQWYRIKYHVCDHDESDRSGCTWDDERTAGSIPEGL